MPVEKISHEESLFEGTEKLNASIEQSNVAVNKSFNAENIANQANTTSNQAVLKAESVQEQFNQVVIEGDSSVEAAQARLNSRGDIFDVLKERIDDLDLDFYAGAVKPRWFGAVGDGITDDTEALQATINHIKVMMGDKGGTIEIPQDKVLKFSQVVIDSKYIKFTGGGTLKGKVLVKSVTRANPSYDNNIKDLFTMFDGIKFINEIGHNADAVVIQNTRCVTFSKCHFENFRYAIHGESIHEDVPYQQTARVLVRDCIFYDVDNCIRTSWKPYYTGVSENWRYSQHGDWHITGCQAYYYTRGTTHFHFEGLDGVLCSKNVLFHQLYRLNSTLKQHNIYLKQTNFAIISDNDLFEAGLESIYCEDVRSLSITDNHIAWPGQKEPRSGIYLEVVDKSSYAEASIIISNNTISYATRHGIHGGFYTTNLFITGNNITKTGNGKFYYGTTDLSTVSHYSIFIGDPPVAFAEQEDVVTSQNKLDLPVYQNRGVGSNNFISSIVASKRTFGNINATPRVVNGVLNLSTIINKNTNPFNELYPFILKGVTGNITDIVGGVGQIVTIICGSGGDLSLNNSGVGENKLNLGGNVTLSTSQYITLQKTDTYWIKL